MVEQQSILTAFFASVMALALFGAFYIGTEDYFTGNAVNTIRVVGKDIEDVLEKETANLSYRDSFYTIKANSTNPINITINRAETAIINILIVPKQEVRAFWLNVSNKLTHPEASKIYYDVPYQFFDIKDSKLANRSMNMTLTFRIAKWWMNKNYVYDDTVMLRRFSSNAWKRIETKLLERSDEYYLFRANTDSLGEFAITGRKQEPPKIQELTAEEIEKITETPASPGIFGIDLVRFAELYWQFIVFPLIGLVVFFAGVKYVFAPLKGFFETKTAEKTLKRELENYMSKKQQIILNEKRKLEVLAEYIKKARKHRSDDWIKASALLKGWPRKTIEKAFKLADKYK